MKKRKERVMRGLTVAGPDGRALFLDLATLQTYEFDRLADVDLGQLFEFSEYQVMDRRKFRLRRTRGRDWTKLAESVDVVVNSSEYGWESHGGPHFTFCRLGEGFGADLR